MQNKRNTKHHFLGLLLLLIGLNAVFFTSCKEEYAPRPKGYFRIDLPEKNYNAFQTECDFKFEYPVYSNMVASKKKGADPCWFDLEFPVFKARLYLSYKPINNNLAELLDDSYSLAMKHQAKADAIDQFIIHKPEKHVYGVKYGIEGETASQVQFVLTDSVDNFFRGALYFNFSPNPDSVAPVVDFIQKDVDHLIETFEWVVQ